MSDRIFALVAAAAIMAGVPAAAADRSVSEPIGEAAQAVGPAPTILASASSVARPESIDEPPVTAKRRHAPRVTSCRCGGDPAELASAEPVPQR